MGLISGSINLFRVYFNDPFRFNTLEISDILDQYSFDQLFSEEKTINYGFIPFEYPDRTSFAESSVIYGEHILFSMRYDEKRINAKFFNLELNLQKKRFMEENKKEFLSKTDIEFIKNSLNRKLAKLAIPNTTIIEILLDPDKKQIIVSNLSTKIFEALSHLMKSAFDINIYQETFVELAKKVLNDPAKIDRLLQIT
ncbi:MAG: hypothetical protein N3C60_02870 [Calditerrivibrio sp.]|nr:hypothetical protein [Calditerrivibrio sp.]